MSEVSASQMEVLFHTLGLNQARQSYRNRFVTGEAHRRDDDLKALVKMGLMDVQINKFPTGTHKIYFATDDGKKLAFKAHLEAAAPSPAGGE